MVSYELEDAAARLPVTGRSFTTYGLQLVIASLLEKQVEQLLLRALTTDNPKDKDAHAKTDPTQVEELLFRALDTDPPVNKEQSNKTNPVLTQMETRASARKISVTPDSEMEFKIVQTVENGVPKLTVVPTLWEMTGIVRWPPKNASNLIKDGTSRPEPEWISYKCVLKRNFIPSYEEANVELGQMKQNTDTDYGEKDHCSGSRMSKLCRTNDNNILALNDIKATRTAQNLEMLEPPSANDSSSLTGNGEHCHVPIDNIVNDISSEDIRTVIANQAAMTAKLDAVLENQNKIALKISSLTVTKASISLDKEIQVNVTLHDQLKMEENENFHITTIENQQQLIMLETNLADMIQKKKFAKTLSVLCSSSVGSGTTCAYKLLDVLFSREFICQCSWSGGSKGHGMKIPLINYKNIRKFFFEMVNSWDSNFTDDDTERFLKTILRNATKRKTMKGLRQSSKKTRKSNTGNDREKLKNLAGEGDNGNTKTEPHCGNESTGNNTEVPQAGEKKEQPKDDDNNESRNEEIDLR